MSVQKILDRAFHTIATRGTLKVSGYGAHTARATAIDRLSPADRMLAALWVVQTATKALDAVSTAFIVARYTGDCTDRDLALDTLTAELMTSRANPRLLRAVVHREFMAGESYCPSTAKLAEEFGSSQPTAWRLAEKVRIAMIDIADRAHDALRPVFAERGYC